MQQDQKTQLASRLKDSNNILVCVSSNPTVDQLSSALALTLMLNKLQKRATAVFSGEVPTMLDFLEPEKTIKKNTDSLRDFIISLDKEKADKLRYKVEDKFVKIYITPYKSALSEKDVIYSQGEVNVEVVVALGVHSQDELDKAIVANGRILHDATVTTINIRPSSNLGSVNWIGDRSSSLCEMLVELADALSGTNIIDTQIANALLTGIVSETQRFSNEKTTSNTMTVSSRLLSLGANQKLVATKLSPPEESEKKPQEIKGEIDISNPPPQPAPPPPPTQPAVEIQKAATPRKKPEEDNGSLVVNHLLDRAGMNDEEEDDAITQVSIDSQGNIKNVEKPDNSVFKTVPGAPSPVAKVAVPPTQPAPPPPANPIPVAPQSPPLPHNPPTNGTGSGSMLKPSISTTSINDELDLTADKGDHEVLSQSTTASPTKKENHIQSARDAVDKILGSNPTPPPAHGTISDPLAGQIEETNKMKEEDSAYDDSDKPPSMPPPIPILPH